MVMVNTLVEVCFEFTLKDRGKTVVDEKVDINCRCVTGLECRSPGS